MLLMEKPKPKKRGRPRKHADDPKSSDKRSSQAVHFYVDPVFMRALDKFRQDFGEFVPPKTEVLERALREYLEKRGYWPPK